MVSTVIRPSCFALWIVGCLLLSGCASVEPVKFKGPNGKTAYSMKCSGWGRTLEDCYQKSGEICPDGYTIVERSSSVSGIPSRDGGTMIVSSQGMAIGCK
jgi:hypothetical protein